MKITAFKTDATLETEGVWVDIGDGAKLKVARLGNPEHKRIAQRLSRPHRGILEGKNLKAQAEVAERLGIQAAAQAILRDWEGLEEEDGTAIEYSTEKAMELLAIADFRDLVLEIADSMEAYRAEEIAESEGNSARVSASGTSGGTRSKKSST